MLPTRPPPSQECITCILNYVHPSIYLTLHHRIMFYYHLTSFSFFFTLSPLSSYYNTCSANMSLVELYISNGQILTRYMKHPFPIASKLQGTADKRNFKIQKGKKHLIMVFFFSLRGHLIMVLVLYHYSEFYIS